MIGVAEERLTLATGDANLEGTLHVPDGSRGLVVFAHGAGSGRHSPRNRHVAAQLEHARISTCLLDLLTPDESESADKRFDIPLLTRRLGATVAALERRDDTRALSIGLFGASTGAAAALYVATEPGARVAAVVSRGGRVDLAAPILERVTAPTLLVVGSLDTCVLDFNRRCAPLMGGLVELAIVPGATHLFEEAGALDDVAHLAVAWFRRYLRAGRRR
jgi:putative phosphoribosyl transferase